MSFRIFIEIFHANAVICIKYLSNLKLMLVSIVLIKKLLIWIVEQEANNIEEETKKQMQVITVSKGGLPTIHIGSV